MKNWGYASALIAVIALSATWTGLMVYRQRAALPVAGLLHRSTVDPTLDRGGHSRGIVQVNLLRQIMADRARRVPAKPEIGHKVATQNHPLLGHPAPAFVLNDASGKTWNLHDEARGGPVVVVFYLGSTCMACVTHLTELEVAMARFTARNTRVLAVSTDTPAFSLERMHKYGGSEIPLLSDADHAVSAAYGVWKVVPGSGNDDGEAQHGTFILDREGLVRWAHVGDRPFSDIEALLAELDAVQAASAPPDSPGARRP
jgi:peroxiredoxin